MLVMPITSQPQDAVEVALRERRELRAVDGDIGAAAVRGDAACPRQGPFDDVAEQRTRRMAERHVRNATGLENVFARANVRSMNWSTITKCPGA